VIKIEIRILPRCKKCIDSTVV